MIINVLELHTSNNSIYSGGYEIVLNGIKSIVYFNM
jgi:hypothetical protein